MPKIEIPSFLSHLKINEKGYPIPFFVAVVNGVPDFRLLDQRKQDICIAEKVCSICGLKLVKDTMFFLSGPLGFDNRVATDPPMHRDCAEYSLKICPHLYFEKAERREVGEHYQAAKENSKDLDPGKPKSIFLIRSSKYKVIPHPGGAGKLLRFNITKSEEYSYQEGVLVKII